MLSAKMTGGEATFNASVRGSSLLAPPARNLRLGKFAGGILPARLIRVHSTAIFCGYLGKSFPGRHG